MAVGSNPITSTFQLEPDTYDMYHYVYCIENLINGKVYVGKHSTENLDDGYMGGGKRIRYAIAKHGLENFRKFIIAELDSSEKAFDLEKLLVTEEFVSGENTYNLTLGGRGSFVAANEFYKNNPEIRKQNSSIAGKRAWLNPDFRKKMSVLTSSRNKLAQANGTSKFKHFDQTGKHHSEESKRKIGKANAIAQKGEKNSQFGTCWVSHPEMKKSQRVNKGEIEGYLTDGWVRGRKMKWDE